VFDALLDVIQRGFSIDRPECSYIGHPGEETSMKTVKLTKTTKKVAVAAGLGTLAAVTLGGVAVAGDGDDGPASHQYTEKQATAATEAALAATGGGTANSVETDNEDGATYEVEVTKPDGQTVDVRLDENYDVVVIEGDSED
jgi:uncharacterized membrane protein YkoI